MAGGTSALTPAYTATLMFQLCTDRQGAGERRQNCEPQGSLGNLLSLDTCKYGSEGALLMAHVCLFAQSESWFPTSP